MNLWSRFIKCSYRTVLQQCSQYLQWRFIRQGLQPRLKNAAIGPTFFFFFFFFYNKEVLQLCLENAAIGILRLGLDCDEKEKNAHLHLKLGLTALFTYLKIILLQYFQFSVLRNKRYPNRPLKSRFTKMWLQCCLQLHVSIAAIG